MGVLSRKCLDWFLGYVLQSTLIVSWLVPWKCFAKYFDSVLVSTLVVLWAYYLESVLISYLVVFCKVL